MKIVLSLITFILLLITAAGIACSFYFDSVNGALIGAGINFEWLTRWVFLGIGGASAVLAGIIMLIKRSKAVRILSLIIDVAIIAAIVAVLVKFL